MLVTIHDYKQPSDGTGFIKTGEQECIIIRLMNFEILPGMIGNIGMRSYDKASHIEALGQIIREVRAESGLRENVMQDVLNPSFLMEEYRRVILGFSAGLNWVRNTTSR